MGRLEGAIRPSPSQATKTQVAVGARGFLQSPGPLHDGDPSKVRSVNTYGGASSNQGAQATTSPATGGNLPQGPPQRC